MNKSTPFNADSSANSLEEKKQKLPTSPKKETVAGIMAFAKAYSVRKGKLLEKMEFILN